MPIVEPHPVSGAPVVVGLRRQVRMAHEEATVCILCRWMGEEYGGGKGYGICVAGLLGARARVGRAVSRGGHEVRRAATLGDGLEWRLWYVLVLSYCRLCKC